MKPICSVEKLDERLGYEDGLKKLVEKLDDRLDLEKGLKRVEKLDELLGHEKVLKSVEVLKSELTLLEKLDERLGYEDGLKSSYTSFSGIENDGLITIINPVILDSYVRYATAEMIGNNPHLYLIPVYSFDFFKIKNEFGFSHISEKYKNDIRNNKCKIIIMILYEGNTGMQGKAQRPIIIW